ncbi:hypothetical protein NXS19_012028 [Fusarium pseudograminearum]|nr:hypothetical protein NXS19_012028 [Fusarium pseudograminearum]
MSLGHDLLAFTLAHRFLGLPFEIPTRQDYTEESEVHGAIVLAAKNAHSFLALPDASWWELSQIRGLGNPVAEMTFYLQQAAYKLLQLKQAQGVSSLDDLLFSIISYTSVLHTIPPRTDWRLTSPAIRALVVQKHHLSYVVASATANRVFASSYIRISKSFRPMLGVGFDDKQDVTL